MNTGKQETTKPCMICNAPVDMMQRLEADELGIQLDTEDDEWVCSDECYEVWLHNEHVVKMGR